MVVIVTSLQTYLHQSASVVTAIKCLFILLVRNGLQSSVLGCNVPEVNWYGRNRAQLSGHTEIILTWGQTNTGQLTGRDFDTIWPHCQAARKCLTDNLRNWETINIYDLWCRLLSVISCENVRDKNLPRRPLGALILASLSRSATPLDALLLKMIISWRQLMYQMNQKSNWFWDHKNLFYFHHVFTRL